MSSYNLQSMRKKKTKRGEAIRLWRQCGFFGRLYWRDQHKSWRWDRGVVAMYKDGPARIEFYSTEAVIAFAREFGAK